MNDWGKKSKSEEYGENINFKTEPNINMTGTTINWSRLKALSRVRFLTLIFLKKLQALTSIKNKWCRDQPSRMTNIQVQNEQQRLQKMLTLRRSQEWNLILQY